MSPSDASGRGEPSPEGIPPPHPPILQRRRLFKRIALGSFLTLGGGGLILWGSRYIPFMTMEGAAGRITALAWSPDSKYIASTTSAMQVGGDRYNPNMEGSTTLQIWDAGQGNCVLTCPFSQNGVFPPPIWSADSQQVLWWGSDQQSFQLYEVRVDAPSPRPMVGTVFQRPKLSTTVAFSPDGQWLAAGGEGSGQFSLYRLNGNGKPSWSYGQPDEKESAITELEELSSTITALAWSPNSLQFAVGRSRVVAGTVRSQLFIMDIASAKPLLQMPELSLGEIGSLAWSLDGNLIAVEHELMRENGGGYLTILDARNGQLVSSYQASNYGLIAGWSPSSSRFLAFINNGNSVKIWDGLRSHGVIATYYHGIGARINVAAWSPDGRYLVAGGDDQRLCIWQVPS